MTLAAGLKGSCRARPGLSGGSVNRQASCMGLSVCFAMPVLFTGMLWVKRLNGFLDLHMPACSVFALMDVHGLLSSEPVLTRCHPKQVDLPPAG